MDTFHNMHVNSKQSLLTRMI